MTTALLKDFGFTGVSDPDLICFVDSDPEPDPGGKK
jgi:hypothetical protein